MIDGRPAAAGATATLEQEAVIQAPVGARLVVTAGPGTGKTFALVERLFHLVETEGLRPSQELLVLSYSRAAVRVMRDRLKLRSADLVFARPSTIDSLATWILAAINPNGQWLTIGYDDRIKAATAALRSQAAVDIIGGYRHFLIDEIQDLVGIRARFLIDLLRVGDVGFTLFGDPAQAIYDFSLGDDREEDRDCPRVYSLLSDAFDSKLIQRSLTNDMRSLSKSVGQFHELGRELREALNTGAGALDFTRVYRSVRSLPSVGDVGKAAVLLVSATASTAVLCRNNGTAMDVSRLLWEQNVPNELRHRATDRWLPRFVGDLIAAQRAPQISREAAMDFARALGWPDTDVCGWWTFLRAIDSTGDNRSIDVTRLGAGARLGRIPDAVWPVPGSALVISSIHRAKGLEFDRVFLARGNVPIEPAFPNEEARTWFVALTRARSLLMAIDVPDYSGLRLDDRTGRWKRAFQGWKVGDVEFRAEDIERSSPFAIDGDATSTQTRIGQLSPGTSVVLKRLSAGPGGLLPIYEVVDQVGAMARTNDSFGKILMSILRRAWNKAVAPIEISGLRVESIETTVGHPSVTEAVGLCSYGFWLTPRICGLARLRYPERNS